MNSIIMKHKIWNQAYLRRRSNRLSGVVPDQCLTLDKCSKIHAATMDIACLELVNGGKGLVVTCSSCHHPARLDILLREECLEVPLRLTHLYASRHIDETFAIINEISPDDDKLWFNCKHAFEIFARKAFSVNKGSASLEEKTLAIANGVALRYTCRNSSRKPHICGWEVRANYSVDSGLWVVAVNQQNHTAECLQHIRVVTTAQKPQSRKAYKSPSKKASKSRKTAVPRLPNEKEVEADRYWAKVLLEFKRFGRVDKWHPKMRLRRASQITEKM